MSVSVLSVHDIVEFVLHSPTFPSPPLVWLVGAMGDRHCHVGEEVDVGRMRFLDILNLQFAPFISCYVITALFVVHCVIASSLRPFGEKTTHCKACLLNINDCKNMWQTTLQYFQFAEIVGSLSNKWNS